MPTLLGADPQAAPYNIYEISDTPKARLGARMTTGDGRIYRYARAGAVALNAGNMLQAPAPIANHLNTTPAAAAIGDTQVTVTLGATAVTANQYANGFAVISTGPGNGIAYRIKSHPAAALSAAVVLTLDDPIQVALTAASRVDLMPNEYDGVIQTPITTLTGAVVGGAVVAVTAAFYCWIQTGGQFAALIDGTPAVGASLSCPGAVAGVLAINSGTLPIAAYALVVGVDTKNKLVKLVID